MMHRTEHSSQIRPSRPKLRASAFGLATLCCALSAFGAPPTKAADPAKAPAASAKGGPTSEAAPAKGAPTPTASASASPAPTKADGSAAATPAAPAEPTDEQVREAGEHYDRGLKLYSEGDYSLAVIEFDRAHALVPDYRVLYNIGQVRIQLANYADARRALEEYLAQGGDRIPAERRKSVMGDLNMLAARTATLRIELNVEGADVSIDDAVVGRSPLPQALLLDAGEHRLSAHRDGFSTETTRLTLAGGDAANARLVLKPVRNTASPIIVEKQIAVEKSNRSAWLWATWSATAGFGAAALITGGLGLQAANQLDAMRTDPSATRSKLDSQERRSRTLLTVADVLGGAAIVTGGVALYITLSGHSERPNTEAPPRARRKVGLALGPRSVSVVGSF